MKVGAVIGQASSPGWFVSEMPKPGAAFQSALAAAAWKVLSLRRHELAVLVLELRERDAVLLGVGVFDIADRVRHLLHERGDALVALAALADRPLHRGVGAGAALPTRPRPATGRW